MDREALGRVVLVVLVAGIVFVVRMLVSDKSESVEDKLESGELLMPGESRHWNRSEVSMTSSRAVTMATNILNVEWDVSSQMITCHTNRSLTLQGIYGKVNDDVKITHCRHCNPHRRRRRSPPDPH
jgi:hypothetical protein